MLVQPRMSLWFVETFTAHMKTCDWPSLTGDKEGLIPGIEIESICDLKSLLVRSHFQYLLLRNRVIRGCGRNGTTLQDPRMMWLDCPKWRLQLRWSCCYHTVICHLSDGERKSWILTTSRWQSSYQIKMRLTVATRASPHWYKWTGTKCCNSH